MKHQLTLFCASMMTLWLGMPSGCHAADPETKAEALIASRKAIKSGEVTFIVKFVMDLDGGKGVVQRVHITFLDNLFKSETLQESGRLVTWSHLGEDFLLSQSPEEKDPAYRKFNGDKLPDLPPGMLDPRLIGVKPGLFMNLGVTGFRAVIGRSDINERRMESRDVGGQKRNIIIEKQATGSTVQTAYDDAGQLFFLETSYELRPGMRYGCRMDIVNGDYDGVRYPKEFDYKIIRDNKVEYHEHVAIESAKFNISISPKDFDLNTKEHPDNTVVFDRGTAEKKVIGTGNTLSYVEEAIVAPKANTGMSILRRVLLIALALALVALVLMLRTKNKGRRSSEA